MPRSLRAALLLCLLIPTSASLAKDNKVRAADGTVLSAVHTQFLEEVEWLISRAERKAFLALKADYQRDGFTRRFWEARDPYPATPVNEFHSQWLLRLEQALEQYGTKYDDRFRMFVLHGGPTELRNSEWCMFVWPLEIWRYTEGDNIPPMTLIFYQRAASGPFRLWQPRDGINLLRAAPMGSQSERMSEDVVAFERDLHQCAGDLSVINALRSVRSQEKMGVNQLVENKPEVRDSEWLQSFRADSTELKPGTPTLAGKLTLAYPEPDRGRTVVQGVVEIAGAEPGDFDGQHAVDLRLVGEILRDEVLFETFRYRYAIPVANASVAPATPATTEGPSAAPPAPVAASTPSTAALPVALAFERQLRPGTYRLILRVEDLRSGKAWREARDFEVPRIELRSDAAEPE